jgi:hypothetical protein
MALAKYPKEFFQYIILFEIIFKWRARYVDGVRTKHPCNATTDETQDKLTDSSDSNGQTVEK